MATTLKTRRAKMAISHSEALELRRTCPKTDVAPRISKERSAELSIFDILPRRSLPPLECGFGVKPSQAAKRHPDLNPVGSGTSAFMEAAMIAPTTGIVASRRTSLSRFASPIIARSSLSI